MDAQSSARPADTTVASMPALISGSSASSEQFVEEELRQSDVLRLETVEAASILPVGVAVAVANAPEPERFLDVESIKTTHEDVDPRGLADQTNYLPKKKV
jgi:hypothetical protein